PSDDFGLAERKDRPDADLSANDVAVLDFEMEDFGRGRRIQAGKRGELVADDQEQFHPQRMMGENGEEDIDDAELRATERGAVGVTKMRAFDELAAQHAAKRDIAFSDGHAMHSRKDTRYSAALGSGLSRRSSATRAWV